MLGPLYMLMGDVDGALASFDWYEDAYPGDSGDPYQYLTWALALFRGGRRQEAFNKLYQTTLENLYLIQILILSVLPIDPGSAQANHLGTDIEIIDVDATDDPLITVDVYSLDANQLLKGEDG